MADTASPERRVAAPQPQPPRRRRAIPSLSERQALAAIAFAFAALTAGVAFRLPVFFGPDERAHFSYVVSLLDGELPEIQDPLPTGRGYPVIDASLGVPYTHEVIWVSNHPPLFYVVAAPVAWFAGALGPDSWPPLTVRLLNLGFMAVGVGVTGLLAAELFPGRRLVSVVAAAIAGTTPHLVGVASYGHNDGLAFALVALGLLLAVRLARDGPTSPRVAAAAGLAAAAALTRASLALLVGALALAAFLGAWLRSPGGRRTLGWLLVPPLAIGGAAVASAGWFYRRNERLYGSATGDMYLFDWLDRRVRGTTLHVLTHGTFHGRVWSGLYGSVHSRLDMPGELLVALTLLAVAVVGGARVLRHRLGGAGGNGAAGHDTVGGPGGALRRITGVDAAPWIVCAVFCTGVVVTTARFYAHGGSPHARYFFPLVPVLSAVLARTALALPGRGRVAAAVVAGLAAVTLSQIVRYPAVVAGPEPLHPFVQPSAGPAWQIAAVLATVAGVAAAIGATRRAAMEAVEAGDPVLAADPRAFRTELPQERIAPGELRPEAP